MAGKELFQSLRRMVTRSSEPQLSPQEFMALQIAEQLKDKLAQPENIYARALVERFAFGAKPYLKKLIERGFQINSRVLPVDVDQLYFGRSGSLSGSDFVPVLAIHISHPDLKSAMTHQLYAGVHPDVDKVKECVMVNGIPTFSADETAIVLEEQTEGFIE